MPPPPIYPLIGASIQIRRKQMKLTQERLAKQLGISRASLANVETGRQKILVHQLYNFAAELGLKITDLLPDPDDIAEIQTASNFPLPKDLKPRERRLIERLLEEVEISKIE